MQVCFRQTPPGRRRHPGHPAVCREACNAGARHEPFLKDGISGGGIKCHMIAMTAAHVGSVNVTGPSGTPHRCSYPQLSRSRSETAVHVHVACTHATVSVVRQQGQTQPTCGSLDTHAVLDISNIMLYLRSARRVSSSMFFVINFICSLISWFPCLLISHIVILICS